MKEYTTLPPLSPDQSAESTLSESEKIKIQRQNLLTLYQKARNLTINFQNQHDKFKTEEDILNSLRERYYDALCRKKFHESDRDIYFKQGDDLVDMRRQLLATSIDILTEQEAYYKASERYNNDILETLKFKDRNISNTERNFQDLQEAYAAIQERYSKQSTELCDVKADLKIEKVECQRLGKKIKNVEGKNQALTFQSTRVSADTGRLRFYPKMTENHKNGLYNRKDISKMILNDQKTSNMPKNVLEMAILSQKTTKNRY